MTKLQKDNGYKFKVVMETNFTPCYKLAMLPIYFGLEIGPVLERVLGDMYKKEFKINGRVYDLIVTIDSRSEISRRDLDKLFKNIEGGCKRILGYTFCED